MKTITQICLVLLLIVLSIYTPVLAQSQNEEKYIKHIVLKGQEAYKIFIAYKIPQENWKELKELNNHIQDINNLEPGDEIKIPYYLSKLLEQERQKIPEEKIIPIKEETAITDPVLTKQVLMQNPPVLEKQENVSATFSLLIIVLLGTCIAILLGFCIFILLQLKKGKQKYEAIYTQNIQLQSDYSFIQKAYDELHIKYSSLIDEFQIPAREIQGALDEHLKQLKIFWKNQVSYSSKSFLESKDLILNLMASAIREMKESVSIQKTLPNNIKDNVSREVLTVDSVPFVHIENLSQEGAQQVYDLLWQSLYYDANDVLHIASVISSDLALLDAVKPMYMGNLSSPEFLRKYYNFDAISDLKDHAKSFYFLTNSPFEFFNVHINKINELKSYPELVHST